MKLHIHGMRFDTRYIFTMCIEYVDPLHIWLNKLRIYAIRSTARAGGTKHEKKRHHMNASNGREEKANRKNEIVSEQTSYIDRQGKAEHTTHKNIQRTKNTMTK